MDIAGHTLNLVQEQLDDLVFTNSVEATDNELAIAILRERNNELAVSTGDAIKVGESCNEI